MCGAYIFEPKIFDYIEKTKPGIKGEVQITDAILLALKNGEKVYGQILKGKYLDIGKWNTVLDTEKDLLKFLDMDMHIKEREKLMERMKEQSEQKSLFRKMMSAFQSFDKKIEILSKKIDKLEGKQVVVEKTINQEDVKTEEAEEPVSTFIPSIDTDDLKVRAQKPDKRKGTTHIDSTVDELRTLQNLRETKNE